MFTIFTNGEDKRGWFVRFTIIRETILGVFLAFFKEQIEGTS